MTTHAVFAALVSAILAPAISTFADDATLRLQIALDAAHFSPGEIDGATGTNTRRALEAWRAAQCGGAAARRPLDPTMAEPTLVPYTVAAVDVAGPFVTIPEDMMEKAALASLTYTSALEALAERFHTSPAFLRKVNAGRELAAGAEILVPNVQRRALGKAARLVVDASDRAVLVFDEAGCAIARYPATTGSENDPLPVGDWKVTETQKDPTFLYNPDLFWDADPTHSKAKLPPGPNNPVGVAWIGLSKEHYGIHGTPEPALIAKTQSHGCIRLTNWDALELAGTVARGTPVVLQE
jgi:lipoprotein-anchoring transpeptidase ErfK/SrfK